MDIVEIRDRKDALCEAIAELIVKFEEETTCAVEERITFKRLYSEENWKGNPYVTLDVGIGYNEEPEDADSEDLPEESNAATA